MDLAMSNATSVPRPTNGKGHSASISPRRRSAERRSFKESRIYCMKYGVRRLPQGKEKVLG